MREAIVTANKISVRKGRGQSFEQLGTYKNGDKITVLDSAPGEDYAMVLWKAGYAYSNKGKYIQFIDPQSPDLTGDTPNAKASENIAVRECRCSNGPVLGEYKDGDSITVLDSALYQDYAKVVWEAGYAYSSGGKYIQFVTALPDEPNAVVTANRISVPDGQRPRLRQAGRIRKGRRNSGPRRYPRLQLCPCGVGRRGRLRLLRLRKVYRVYRRAAGRRYVLP